MGCMPKILESSFAPCELKLRPLLNSNTKELSFQEKKNFSRNNATFLAAAVAVEETLASFVKKLIAIKIKQCPPIAMI